MKQANRLILLLLFVVARYELLILTNLKPYLSKLSDSSLSRQIKRLHIFGMIKRVPGTYRYYLTKLGRAATATCVHGTEFTILPILAIIA